MCVGGGVTSSSPQISDLVGQSQQDTSTHGAMATAQDAVGSPWALTVLLGEGPLTPRC